MESTQKQMHNGQSDAIFPYHDRCIMCIKFHQVPFIIGVVDSVMALILVAVTIALKVVCDQKGYSVEFSGVIIAFGLTLFFVIYVPRLLIFLLYTCFRFEFRVFKIYYMIRAISTLVQFILLLIFLSILVVMNSDTNVVTLNSTDSQYVFSQSFKALIIQLTFVITIITMMDLYLTVLMRIQYLNLLNYSPKKEFYTRRQVKKEQFEEISDVYQKPMQKQRKTGVTKNHPTSSYLQYNNTNIYSQETIQQTQIDQDQYYDGKVRGNQQQNTLFLNDLPQTNNVTMITNNLSIDDDLVDYKESSGNSPSKQQSELKINNKNNHNNYQQENFKNAAKKTRKQQTGNLKSNKKSKKNRKKVSANDLTTTHI